MKHKEASIVCDFIYSLSERLSETNTQLDRIATALEDIRRSASSDVELLDLLDAFERMRGIRNEIFR